MLIVSDPDQATSRKDPPVFATATDKIVHGLYKNWLDYQRILLEVEAYSGKDFMRSRLSFQDLMGNIRVGLTIQHDKSSPEYGSSALEAVAGISARNKVCFQESISTCPLLHHRRKELADMRRHHMHGLRRLLAEIRPIVQKVARAEV